MKADQQEKLQAACDLIGERRRGRIGAAAIINELVRDHGAKLDQRIEPYKLTVAGVAASCTHSRDEQLLNNWVTAATLRLMRASQDRVEASRG